MPTSLTIEQLLKCGYGEKDAAEIRRVFSVETLNGVSGKELPGKKILEIFLTCEMPPLVPFRPASKLLQVKQFLTFRKIERVQYGEYTWRAEMARDANELQTAWEVYLLSMWSHFATLYMSQNECAWLPDHRMPKRLTVTI